MVGEAEAEDVVQEALLAAWRLTKEEPKNWENWLFRCLVNQAKTTLRRRKEQPHVFSIDQILEDR
jgi:DNA-directed RNA polymerase specialized sigma24 family protein